MPRLYPDNARGIDQMGSALVSIDYSHHEIHNGESFAFYTVDATMADTETLIVAFKTPIGTTRVHMLIDFESLVGGVLELIEAPTWTTNTGTATSAYNRSRDASAGLTAVSEDKTATPVFASGKVLVNPTGLTGGTSLFALYAWGEKGKIAAGGSRATDEWILRPATQYAIRFTAIGAANKGAINLNWYEHTDSH